MDFTSRQLRAFHLVAHHRSFARAAEALLITPSGLSVLVRELERQLGFRLFDRTTRQVALTSHGAELLAVTQPGLRALDTAMAGIEQAAKGKNRWISLGTTPWIAANVLPPVIQAFRQQRPDIGIRLFDGTLTAIERRVKAGKLDLGLGLFNKMPDMRRIPFFRFSLMLIRADKKPAFSRVSTPWPTLSGETLISLTNNYPHQRLIDKQLAELGVACRRGQTVNLLDTQIGLVEAEQGIAIIPSFGIPDCRRRGLTMSELIEPVVSLEFYQITRRGAELPAEAAQFSQFLKMSIARWAGEAGIL